MGRGPSIVPDHSTGSAGGMYAGPTNNPHIVPSDLGQITGAHDGLQTMHRARQLSGLYPVVASGIGGCVNDPIVWAIIGAGLLYLGINFALSRSRRARIKRERIMGEFSGIDNPTLEDVERTIADITRYKDEDISTVLYTALHYGVHPETKFIVNRRTEKKFRRIADTLGLTVRKQTNHQHATLDSSGEAGDSTCSHIYNTELACADAIREFIKSRGIWDWMQTDEASSDRERYGLEFATSEQRKRRTGKIVGAIHARLIRKIPRAQDNAHTVLEGAITMGGEGDYGVWPARYVHGVSGEMDLKRVAIEAMALTGVPVPMSLINSFPDFKSFASYLVKPEWRRTMRHIWLKNDFLALKRMNEALQDPFLLPIDNL